MSDWIGEAGCGALMNVLRSIGTAQKVEVNKRKEVAMNNIKLNHVKMRAGREKSVLRVGTREAKRTKTTMRMSMMTVPKIATFGLIPKETTIAMTARMPPTLSAYLTAGTALIARVSNDGAEMESGGVHSYLH